MNYKSVLESYVSNPMTEYDISDFKISCRRHKENLKTKQRWATIIALLINLAAIVAGLSFSFSILAFLLITVPLYSLMICLIIIENIEKKFSNSHSIRISGVDYFSGEDSFNRVTINTTQVASSILATNLLQAIEKQGRAPLEFEKLMIANLVNI